MLRRTYEGQVCSIARALEVVGDRWTLLIIRDLVLGTCRFDEFEESLGLPSNVLTERLNRLVGEGIVDRLPYTERPRRFEYRLTRKGGELGLALLALMQWGDRHISDKPPRLARRRSDLAAVSVRLVAEDGSTVPPDDLELVPGPGAPSAGRSSRVARASRLSPTRP